MASAAAPTGTPVDWATIAIILSIIAQFVWPFVWYIWKEHKKRVEALEKKADEAAPSTSLDALRTEVLELEERRRKEYREDMQQAEERHTAAMQRMEDKHQSDFKGLSKDINGMALAIRQEMSEQAKVYREDVIERVEAQGRSFEQQMAMLVKLLESRFPV